jgi:uncharacterized protein
MKLTLASRSQYFISGYTASEIRLGERVVRSNCLIAPDQLLENWTTQDVKSLSIADLQSVFALKPELVILGTGARQQFPAPAIQAAFLAREIGFEVMDIGAACRTFNVLLSEDRRVVAAMLLDK